MLISKNLLIIDIFLFCHQKNWTEIFSSYTTPVSNIPNNITDVTKLDDVGEKRASSHLELAINQNIVSEQKLGITEILQLCRENGWTPIVITTPLTIYYNKWFSTDFINTFIFKSAKYFLTTQNPFIGTIILNAFGARYYKNTVYINLETNLSVA